MGCGGERHLAAKVGTFRKNGEKYNQPHWLQCFQGAKGGTGPQSKLLLLLLTSWSRVFPEILTGSQLLKKFPAFYGTLRFTTAFTSARHLSLSWASSIQTVSPISYLLKAYNLVVILINIRLWALPSISPPNQSSLFNVSLYIRFTAVTRIVKKIITHLK